MTALKRSSVLGLSQEALRCLRLGAAACHADPQKVYGTASCLARVRTTRPALATDRHNGAAVRESSSGADRPR